MSAETLRKAAAMMRARADVWEFHAGRWVVVPSYAGHSEIRAMDMDDPELDPSLVDNSTFVVDCDTSGTAEHIASWHPAVALAVADWLDAEALKWERVAEFDRAYGDVPDEGIEVTRANDVHHALTVARVYSGESA